MWLSPLQSDSCLPSSRPIPGRECAGKQVSTQQPWRPSAECRDYSALTVCQEYGSAPTDRVRTLDKPKRGAMIPGAETTTNNKKGDGTLGWLRERNRERVIAVLRTLGRTSQADIARSTGLSRTTVSTLVAELRDAGLVFEVDAKVPDGRGGRPGVQLVLQDSSRAVVGIDVGHSHVQVAVADLAHDVLAERMCDLEVRDHAFDALDRSARMVEEVLVEAGGLRSHVLSPALAIPC